MRAKLFRNTVLLVVTVISACRRGPVQLAEVGGRAITTEDLTAAVVAQTNRPIGEVSPELIAALFENYLEEEVLLAASGQASDRRLTGAQRTERARQLVATMCAPSTPPGEAELDAYLAAHPSPSGAGARLRVRQLTLPDRPAAEAARDRLRRGEAFETVSREVSRAPNAAAGGMLGWIERGQLAPEFEAAVFGLAKGEVSAPVESNAGWHVFEVVERTNGGGPADPSVRERARAELSAQAAEAERRACLRRLAAKVGLQVDCRAASFPCRNPFEEKP